MARVGTTKFNLGMSEQGDNPGAGSQDQTTYASNTGLNGNWAKIEQALVQHKVDGTHEDDVIDGRSIKASMADGTSIAASAGTGVKTFGVKLLGIITGMVADLAITLPKLAAACVDNSKMLATVGSEAVNTNVMRDGCATGPKIAALAIDVTKFAANHVGYEIYGDTRVAGFAVGNTVPAPMEWAENSASDVVKISLKYHPQMGDRYIKLVCRIKTGNAANLVKATISDGGTSASVTSNATAYTGGSGSLFVAILDYGTILNTGAESYATSGTVVDLTISLACAGGSTGNMKDVAVYVLKGSQS